jgi:hypothetical protein
VRGTPDQTRQGTPGADGMFWWVAVAEAAKN